MDHHNVLGKHHITVADIVFPGEKHRVVLVKHHTVLGEHHMAAANIALMGKMRHGAVVEDRGYEKKHGTRTRSCFAAWYCRTHAAHFFCLVF